uniref:DZF domain-containing protein n=1 Tax=Timema poppense TaxID=170557 RepID=A0A7R9CQ54_TIMPO|nr:unnamed protein product [Timema poppensis]
MIMWPFYKPDSSIWWNPVEWNPVDESATGAAAYQTGQTGYAVTPTAATAATYTAQRPGTGYEAAYQTAATHTTPGTYAVGAGTAATATTYDYGYGRTAQTAYDSTKTYYQQPAAAAAAAATYSTTDTHYQDVGYPYSAPHAASKPAFSTTSTYPATTRQVTPAATPKATSYSTAYTSQGTQQGASYSTGYTAAAAQTTNTTKATAVAANTTYSGYDAALYSAATMYVAQQAQTGTVTGTTVATPTNTATSKPAGSWQGYKKGPMSNFRMKPKLPPKPMQLHYCDVCKISCAGPQTYREHLEGQKHKKKESALKAGSAPVARGGNALRCELCDVTCTGSDAYAAHIRGAKHQKVVKLHTKLGKPIPSTDPVVLGVTKATTAVSPTSTTSTAKVGGAVKTTTLMTGGVKKTITAAPKINFVAGKVVNFNCKLCECKFNDPNAKEMHMKGRRHRLQFKRKVNPELIVDVKPSTRIRKIQEDRLRRIQLRDEYWRRLDEERMIEEEERMWWEERRRYEEEMEYFEWCRRMGRDPRALPPPPPRPFGPPGVPPLMFFPPQPPMRRLDSSDDRHVIARHAEIYPKEDELQAVQRIVSHTEKALKFVSDHLADQATAAAKAAAAKSVAGATKPTPGTVKPPVGVIKPVTVPVKPGQGPVRPPAPTMAKPGAPPIRPQIGAPLVRPGFQGVRPPLAQGVKPVQTPGTRPPGPGAKTPVITPPATPKPVATSTPVPQVKVETTKVDKSRDVGKKEDGRDGNLFSFQRDKDDSQVPRVLKGVMRVGVLAKGLLLHGDTAVNLVVLCAEKPTRTLLNKVAENLPKQLQIVCPEETYKVHRKVDEAAILVMGVKEPHITVTITLTSPVMREPLLVPQEPVSGGKNWGSHRTPGRWSNTLVHTLTGCCCFVFSPSSSNFLTPLLDSVSVSQAQVNKDPPDVLDKQKCLDALAALRHAKWFQARATGLPSCVMVIRILRDLCQRVPTWAPLHSWAMELLVEKVISSSGAPLSPGESLRRVLESLASGILLPGGPGLLDPCEKDPVDAAGNMQPQQREDITASAQHALRLLAFRQIHKVLGMDHLPVSKFRQNRFNPRKRRRDNSSGEGNDSEVGDGKKDKKDTDAEKMETEKVGK